MIGGTEHYSLRVHPGLLRDGTYGVYAVPDSNPAVEYQLDAQFLSTEDAVEMAHAYQRYGGSLVKDSEVAILGTPELQLNSVVSSRTADKQEKVLIEELKSLFKLPETARFRPFSRITEGTPYALSIVTLIVFFFSVSFTVPSWIPVIGDWVGGKTVGREQLATFFPFILLTLTVLLQLRVRQIGWRLADLRDHVLAVVLNHGWRREKFAELFLDAIDSSRLGWIRKFAEWLHSWNPDTLREVKQSLTSKLKGRPNETDILTQYQELDQRALSEDFEARIHALYFMEREKGFRPHTMVLHPIFFLTPNRRAVRRLQAVTSGGLRALVSHALRGLPGGFEDRIRRRLFPLGAIYEVLVIGGPLVWSFAQKPWSGAAGLVGMCGVVIGVLGPMLAWNYNLLVRSRGIPRGMSWDEIQGDQRFIRGL